jgi:hypothetical protein
MEHKNITQNKKMEQKIVELIFGTRGTNLNKGPYHYALGNTKEQQGTKKQPGTKNLWNYFFKKTRGTNLLKQKGTNHYSLGDKKEHHIK